MSSTPQGSPTPPTPRPDPGSCQEPAGVSELDGGGVGDGRDTRWAAHRSSRRMELVDGARKAVHRLGPGLSMDDIAAHLGTSKSILYRYFDDKSGLQTALGEAVLHELREALAEVSAEISRPRQRIAAMVGLYLELIESSPNVYSFVTRPEAGAAAGQLRGFVAEIEDLVADSLLPVLLPEGARAEAEDSITAAAWASGVVGLVRGSAERWLASRDGSAGVEQGEASAGQPGETSSVEQGIAAIDRAALTEQMTTWLWEGAAGVGRRVRNQHSTRNAGTPRGDEPAAHNQPNDEAPGHEPVSPNPTTRSEQR